MFCGLEKSFERICFFQIYIEKLYNFFHGAISTEHFQCTLDLDDTFFLGVGLVVVTLKSRGVRLVYKWELPALCYLAWTNGTFQPSWSWKPVSFRGFASLVGDFCCGFEGPRGIHQLMSKVVSTHLWNILEHTPKPLPTGYKGIPFIIGEEGIARGVRYRGVLSFSLIMGSIFSHFFQQP